MNILYITNDLSCADGWSVYGSNNAHEAARNGHTVSVCVQKQDTTKSDTVSVYPILCSQNRLLWNPFTIFIQWFKLRKIIAICKPDIMHVVVEPYIQMCILPIPKSCAIVLTIHGTYAAFPELLGGRIRRLLSRYFFKRVLKRVTKVVCISEFTKKRFLTYATTVDPQKIRVIHSSLQKPVREVVTHAEYSVEGRYHAMTVGAVKRRKGIREAIILLSAWAVSRKRKVTYFVVGSLTTTPWYVREVQELAKQLQSDFFEVQFLGHISEEEKGILHTTASVYLHLERVMDDTRDVEGLGIGTIEAAFAGIPSLVAMRSATAEAVCDGESGYVVDLDDMEAMLTALDHILLKHSLTLSRIQACARKFLPEAQFVHMRALYEELESKR